MCLNNIISLFALDIPFYFLYSDYFAFLYLSYLAFAILSIFSWAYLYLFSFVSSESLFIAYNFLNILSLKSNPFSSSFTFSFVKFSILTYFLSFGLIELGIKEGILSLADSFYIFIFYF